MTHEATDITVAETWSAVLGVKQVDVNDKFLALGGESLLAAQISSRLFERYGVRLPLRSVFLGTPATVAAEINAARTGA